MRPLQGVAFRVNRTVVRPPTTPATLADATIEPWAVEYSKEIMEAREKEMLQSARLLLEWGTRLVRWESIKPAGTSVRSLFRNSLHRSIARIIAIRYAFFQKDQRSAGRILDWFCDEASLARRRSHYSLWMRCLDHLIEQCKLKGQLALDVLHSGRVKMDALETLNRDLDDILAPLGERQPQRKYSLFNPDVYLYHLGVPVDSIDLDEHAAFAQVLGLDITRGEDASLPDSRATEAQAIASQAMVALVMLDMGAGRDESQSITAREAETQAIAASAMIAMGASEAESKSMATGEAEAHLTAATAIMAMSTGMGLQNSGLG